MRDQPLVFIDLETTGTNAQFDEIIEIGLIRMENGREVGRFQTLVRPERPVPQFISHYTGITRAMLENAPAFSQVAETVENHLADAIFVAHNVRFDYSFMRQAFSRLEKRFQARQLCTVKLARHFYPKLRRHNLDALIEHFDLSCPNRHRALDDALAIQQFFGILSASFPTQKVTEYLTGSLKTPTLPKGLSKNDIERLPEEPGVYIFRGAENYPLYVGKSINIKERVLSHFRSDLTSTREMAMAGQVESIDTLVTAGELGALLTESELIKKLMPLYNRMLRMSQELVVLSQIEHKEGYLGVASARVKSIEPDDIGNVLGVFRSNRQAKERLDDLAQTYALCPSLLGLEKTSRGCFSYQLGKCRGACLAKERPVAYNMRFVEAFTAHRVQPWPFKGPIIFTETSRDESRHESFMIDKWCLLRRVAEDEAGALGTNEQLSFKFDVDTYKIIRRHLLAKDHRYQIRVVPGRRASTLAGMGE